MYAEERVDYALREADDGSEYIAEIWANTDTGTWTLLGTNFNGISCVFFGGFNYDGQTLDTLFPVGVAL